MEVKLKAGETAYQCLIPGCGCISVSEAKEHVRMVRCDNCGSVFVKAVKIQRTVVRGVGSNKMADMGLALLMEMGADAPEPKENSENSEKEF